MFLRFKYPPVLETLCGRGGIGRRARLRSVWLRPCEFKSRRPHLMYSHSTAMKKKSVAVVIVSNGPGELATWVNPLVNELNKISKSLLMKITWISVLG